MKKKLNTRALRQLVKEVMGKFVEEGAILEAERADFTTSLVRQWIGYEGNATFFLGEQQTYFVLGRTPLGKPYAIPEPAMPGWVNQLTRDWHIDPEELPEIFDQLNRTQSAEVTNTEGIPLRLWVNPLGRSRGVEPLVKQPVPPGSKRDYRKIAATELEQQVGDDLDPAEMEALACSLVKQWQKYGGEACLFVDDEQLTFTITEHAEGCQVTTERRSVNLESLLDSLGFPPEVVSEVNARINLGQEVEFRDRQGVPSLLWHDPKARRLLVRSLNPIPAPATSRSLFCPKCTAVLKPWRKGERQQTCPVCGHVISLS